MQLLGIWSRLHYYKKEQTQKPEHYETTANSESFIEKLSNSKNKLAKSVRSATMAWLGFIFFKFLCLGCPCWLISSGADPGVGFLGLQPPPKWSLILCSTIVLPDVQVH
jgi:hypothetical protein